MKKITLLLLVWICAMSAFSMRYLVQLGTAGAATWRTPVSGVETLVDLSSIGQSLNEWYNTTILVGDEVWIIKGTYELTGNLNVTRSNHSVYGGFSGTENFASERYLVSGGEKWDFTNPTVLDGSNSVPAIVAGGHYPNVFFNGLTLTNCKGTNGGAVSIRGGITVENCIISNNTATAAGGGVMLWVAGVLKHCLIENNTAAGAGGGVYSNNSSTVYTPLISDCVIQNNKTIATNATGGGIHGQGAGLPTTVTNTIIRGNRAADADGNLKPGGAVYTNSIQNIFTNCVITNNTGSIALYLSGGEIINSTIANNTGALGAVYVAGANLTKLTNCVIWSNSLVNFSVSAGGVNANGIITNCGVNPGIQYFESEIWIQNNNFILEAVNNSDDGNKGPKFKNPTLFVGIPTTEAEKSEMENADWNISSSSGAIDKGITIAGLTTDIAGNSRPKGTAYDVGAYEFDPLMSAINKTDLSFGYYTSDTGISLYGLAENKSLEVYTVTGLKIASYITKSADMSITLPNKGVYILRVDKETVKVSIF